MIKFFLLCKINYKLVITALFLSFFIFSSSFSQELTKDFIIPTLQHKSKSAYREVQFIDSRKDSLSMGFVRLGAFNQKAQVVCLSPFKNQLQDAALTLVDTALKNGPDLCFQLRKLFFCETNNGKDEFGIFIFRANLYRRTGNAYQVITTLDTSIIIKAFDVTKKLLENGGSIINGFLLKGLYKNNIDSTLLSIDYVRNIDRVEKLKKKLYTTSHFVDGTYLSYTSFSQQSYDLPLIVDSTKRGKMIIKTADKNGKITKVEKNNIYAFVYKGQPFIVNGSEYCKLVKQDHEFRFNGKIATIPKGGPPIIIGGGLLGLAVGMGTLISSESTDRREVFEMELDHLTGSFIPIRKLH